MAFIRVLIVVNVALTFLFLIPWIFDYLYYLLLTLLSISGVGFLRAPIHTSVASLKAGDYDIAVKGKERKRVVFVILLYAAETIVEHFVN